MSLEVRPARREDAPGICQAHQAEEIFLRLARCYGLAEADSWEAWWYPLEAGFAQRTTGMIGPNPGNVAP